MYKQRGVHVQLESSKYTIREQCMYNQKAVNVQPESIHLQPESITCTSREQFM
jgi:hypothetical protein